MRSNHTQQKVGRTFVAVEMQSNSDSIVVSEPIYALPNSYRAHKNSQKTTTTYSYRAHKNSQKTTTTYCPFSMTSSLHSTDGRKEVTTVNTRNYSEKVIVG